MLTMQEKYWTPKELAELYKVSEETIRRYIRKKQLKAIRIGDNLRVADTAWQEFINKHNN